MNKLLRQSMLCEMTIIIFRWIVVFAFCRVRFAGGGEG